MLRLIHVFSYYEFTILALCTQLPGFKTRSRVKVTEQNFRLLQLLDLFKDIEFYSEIDQAERQNRIVGYMEKCGIRFSALDEYLPYYPDKIYKNMYEMGLLNGIPA